MCASGVAPGTPWAKHSMCCHVPSGQNQSRVRSGPHGSLPTPRWQTPPETLTLVRALGFGSDVDHVELLQGWSWGRTVRGAAGKELPGGRVQLCMRKNFLELSEAVTEPAQPIRSFPSWGILTQRPCDTPGHPC